MMATTTKKKRAAQPRSRGRIEVRGPGKYLVRVYKGTDDRTGKRLYVSQTITGAKRDADKALTLLLRETDTDTAVAPTKATLADYLDAWLKGKRKISPATRGTYAYDLSRIKPIIGKLKLSKLTKDDVQHLYDTLIEQGLTPTTLHHIHGTLRQALLAAVEADLLRKTPTKGIELPPKEHTEVQILTPEQVDLLLETTKGTDKGTMWALALTTGLRPQELIPLKWSDFDGNTLYIQRAVSGDRIKGCWKVGDTKTKKSRRRILLPKGTIAALEDHRARQDQEIASKYRYASPEGYIFTNRSGHLFNPSTLRHRWQDALAACGLPKARLYDARHSHATHLLMAGQSPKVVAERLGHSTIMTTMDIYSTVIPEIESGAVDAVQEMIYGRHSRAVATD